MNTNDQHDEYVEKAAADTPRPERVTRRLRWLPMSAREELAAVIWDVVVDHPMWIGDDGEPLEYLPEREGRIADAVHAATDALLASPALANLIREKQVPAIALGQRVTDWLRERDDQRADQVEGGA